MQTPTLEKIYTVIKAESLLPLIFDSPHSGRGYPDDFGYSCALHVLQQAEDNNVDHLFESVPNHGGTLLCAQFPRTYIDTNRAADDVEEELLESSTLPSETFRPTERARAGIGLVRRLVRPGIPVYDRKLTSEEIKHRIDHYYTPYHTALKELIDDAHNRCGVVWHINCHSMPSGALSELELSYRHPDFVLGDRNSTSCSPSFTHALRDCLKKMGYRVAINHPYKGLELVRRYSDPATGRHSLQIEINKALYWNEHKNIKSKNYNNLRKDIDTLVSFCAEYVKNKLAKFTAD